MHGCRAQLRGRGPPRRRDREQRAEQRDHADDCSALGDSPKIAAAASTDPIGWSVSSSEVIAAGRRGSEIVIASQPMTCELNASSTSQPAPGQPGTSRASPITMPAAMQSTVAVAVASNSGPAGRRRSTPPRRSSSRKPT